MDASDPTPERQRLARVYAEMSEGQLQKLGDSAATLTEEAREALRAELHRRRLDIKLAGSEPPNRLRLRELVTVGTFRDLPEALLAKGMLESADIETSLADDNMVRMDWFFSNLLGGIKLCVAQEDALVAANLLNRRIPNAFSVPGVGDYQQPRCPHCQSLDISFEDLHKPAAWISSYLGLPIPFPRRRWKCQSCDREWREAEPKTA